MPKEIRVAFRRTHWKGLRKIPVEELRLWPIDIINSFLDEAIAEDDLRPSLSTRFYSFIRYAEVTGDVNIKKRIKERIESFSESEQQKLKNDIFRQML